MKLKSLTQNIVRGGANKRPSKEAVLPAPSSAPALLRASLSSPLLLWSVCLWTFPVPACHPPPFPRTPEPSQLRCAWQSAQHLSLGTVSLPAQRSGSPGLCFRGVSGAPSSLHEAGRNARAATVAEVLGFCEPAIYLDGPFPPSPPSQKEGREEASKQSCGFSRA